MNERRHGKHSARGQNLVLRTTELIRRAKEATGKRRGSVPFLPNVNQLAEEEMKKNRLVVVAQTDVGRA